jgi:hypothetical protein
MMKKLVFTLTAGTLLCASSAFGQIWAEVASGGTNGATDAGPLLATANITSGVGPLTNITGSLTAGTYPDFVDYDADMFCIRIDDPMAFSATSLSGDTVLALFDMNGVAIAFNDNRTDSLTATTSQLSASWISGLVAGQDYFLGVSRVTGNDALRRYTRPIDSNGNLIFSGPANLSDINDPNYGDRRADLLPITAGTVLAGWEVQPIGTPAPFNASYNIELAGVTYSVPAPAGLGLLGLGALGALRRRR